MSLLGLVNNDIQGSKGGEVSKEEIFSHSVQ